MLLAKAQRGQVLDCLPALEHVLLTENALDLKMTWECPISLSQAAPCIFKLANLKLKLCLARL